ncbi:MAG: Grx4 family monothiol glutaredoxin [Deltaproteobacteria bacterium]|nr:Grx4 family monothiol glutaredoxin [Deltaproteobacteria bacterium]
MASPELIKKVDEQVKKNKVIIYMKGNKEAPRCGFSSAAVEVLKSYNVPFESVDVLADEDLWEALEEYSKWPTVPQIFINGEFVGGSDIVRELHAKGELKKIIAG